MATPPARATPTGGAAGQQQPRRNLRKRLACTRCQRRKIRCDGQVPTCHNCRKASAECVDGESVRLGEAPRAQIARLRERVQWLESIIRARCPDVDLSHPLAADVSSDALIDSSTISTLAPLDDADSEATVTLSALNASAPEPITIDVAASSAPRPFESQTQPQGHHEIGLVSLGSSQDMRYIGPSSGYFLARLMLTSGLREPDTWRSRSAATLPPPAHDLVDAMQGPLPLPPLRQAQVISNHYFDALHCQYPILHRPSFFDMLDRISTSKSEPEPEEAFQVYMVLAIGSIVASHRRRLHLPAESYCLSALKLLDRVNVENSLRGLQCLLLLLIFTMHCSNMRLNVWYLNYQCIAAVLDLGLQRNITTKTGISLLDQEMRTRVFWVVFTLDRRIATMMGRPIGLRDEACDLRLPQLMSDEALTPASDLAQPDSSGDEMGYSNHLFRLAKLNSEIKYVANSIVRDTPTYAYPAIVDIHHWQAEMLRRLDEWAGAIPASSANTTYIHINCHIRCCSLKMVLLRPSPNIPNPSQTSLTSCHEAAKQTLRLFGQLYKSNLLVHSWDAFYSVVLSAITLMYCIKTVPDLAKSTESDTFLGDMGECMSILSASGEHWPAAKRCRDIIDGLSRALTRWLKDPSSSARGGSVLTSANDQPSRVEIGTLNGANEWPEPGSHHLGGLPAGCGADNPIELMANQGAVLPFFEQDTMDSFLGLNWPLGHEVPNYPDNFDAIMRNLFDDFIPTGSSSF